jgi:catechol 2,3-dioxygenase-like lactoylglutathione lyase family enzyme
MKTCLCAGVVAFALAAFTATPAIAQLAPPNAKAVTVGHIHLAVTDVDAQRTFWTKVMGGTAVQHGPLSLIQFPGVFIMLRKAEPSAPPAGGVVNHFGFAVKDLPAEMARWKANNVKIDQAENPNQGYVNAPDGVRVEFFGDPTLTVPVKMDHIHWYGVDVPPMQAWYAGVFGGVPGTRARVARPGIIDTDFFPGGINLSFSPSDTVLAPIRGRSLDHIGFDVTNLDEFVKGLEAKGIKLDSGPRLVPGTNIKIAFLTDPWGTYIEITEKLSPN